MALGTIPYPQLNRPEDDTNPLQKYKDQLNPLGQLTHQMFAPPAPPPIPPIDPRIAQHMTQMGAQGMTPTQLAPPPSPLAAPPPAPPPPAPPMAAPSPPPALSMMPGPQGAAMLRAAAPGMAPGAPGDGGPHDLTQFAQDPTSGGLVRQRGAVAQRLAAQTMGSVPTFAGGGGGSAALAQAGGRPLAPEDAQGVIAPPSAAGADPAVDSQSHNRISTRIPSEPAQKKAGIDAHATSGLSIDMNSMNAATDQKAKNAAIIKQHYPGFAHLRTDNPDQINEAFIRHAKDNLVWLYRKMNDKNGPIGPGIVERAKRWYSGANKIAHDLAKEFGVQPYQAAAVLASLSPQKDWYQNVDLARRAFTAHKLGNNWTMTEEMKNYSDKYIASLEKAAANPKTRKGENPEENIGELRELQQKFHGTPMSELTDPYERAVFARWHDEAHTPRSYKMVTPEGEMGDTAMIPAKYTKKGKLKEASRPRDVTWGSFSEIQKAMAALQNADLPEVSRLMGKAHKVRNFFNNIIAPHHGHDVTIDTHAIAAALLRPLGASAMEVAHGLGTNPKQSKEEGAVKLPQAGNSMTLGNKGMYGLYAEAYRQAAKDLGILPRELQSVTWEGIRGIFSPEQKRNPGFVREIADMWRNKGAHRGKTPDERREAILTHAGGLKLPSWAGGVDHGDDAED
jgi:hypothetical protein